MRHAKTLFVMCSMIVSNTIFAADLIKTLPDDLTLSQAQTVIQAAVKKARTARYFNMSARGLGNAAQPGKELYGIEVTNNGLAIFAGGVLLVNSAGIIAGSVGVSGGSVDEDKTVAKAAASALPKK
ncbi:heme-binding protein [Neisseria weixii]|uniref:heme-binding protein n=1 Tax=Neisseria weixii TaxID=1853276 RepID=UPI000BB6C21A|nr:heme-binding protein [Neisseria weixii]ATD64297.1 PduO protein [Neisseria weixii]